MIDKRKNICYLIKMNYWYRDENINEIRTQKFISMHQITSKRFKGFYEQYFKAVEGYDGLFYDDIGSQWTVSKDIWSQVKDDVMSCITENEKCY